MIQAYLTKEKVAALMLVAFIFPLTTLAETVSGGGYTVQQVIAPINGSLTGNGYQAQSSAQQNGGIQSGGGFTLFGVFGVGTTTPVTPPTPPSPGGSFISGGGYFVYPTQNSTGTVIIITASGTPATITPVGSSCSSRVTFSAPIDIGLETNRKEDVVKLENFLNTYENEKLPVNGIYEKRDVEAVKRWQWKYKSYILDPMKLRQPTGTVYALSQRQIERQSTTSCGEPVVVSACPYFREYAAYGDRGEDVKKIQLFLNIVRGEKLPISGVYGPLTKAATKRFQQAYKKDIFNILKLSFISGNWNEATRVKANQAIGCDIIK
jgi:peptidoglycan hydrolase-like protein with peptidoglycan-binding domain